MDLNDIATQILYTTAPIWTEKSHGHQESGTAFFFAKPLPDNKSIPFLVTNKHIVENSLRGFIALSKKKGDMPIYNDRIVIELDGKFITSFCNTENDLAIFPVGPLFNNLQGQGIEIFFRSITPDIVPNEDIVDKLSAIEEITFIGYPSGLYDRQNNLPIVRQGITASPVWNDFEGDPIFLIDAGVYPGSSGSPVFIYNRGSIPVHDGISIGIRLLFIGIITETLTRPEEKGFNVYLGLGRVLKSKFIKDYIETISERVK